MHVVIASHPADVHAHAVRHELGKLGARVTVIDPGRFTIDFGLDTRIGAQTARAVVLDGKSGECLDLASVAGLWWRRPYLSSRREARPTSALEATARNERRAAIMGSLDAFVGNAFNDPARSQQAASKPTQLLRASRLGLVVPDTLITNEPDEARAFIGAHPGRVVYKMLTGTAVGLYGTRRVEEGDSAQLDRLRTCPAIFQRYIDGAFDVRAIVIGDRVFAGRIDYSATPDAPDTRFVPTRVSPFRLPTDVEEKLVRLVSAFGLVYSAVDLRYSPADGFVFFESNPEGQFLWIEIEADLPISAEIARRLVV